jgi:UDP-N-acetylmuramoylalanine--D-glutamate ligase
MHIRDLAGKKVCILGFGREGQATARALEKYAPTTEITIADANPDLRVAGHASQTGRDYLKNLGRFDVIIRSPGFPPPPELRAVYEKVTTATQIFFDSIVESGATVIGVTGSKGKSTTASLIAAILARAKKNVHLVGNIGTPALDFLDRARRETIFVMELSSYQLMDLSRSPRIAVITAFFPEHLDYHGSLEAYLEAKEKIARNQTSQDIVVYNGESKGATTIAQLSPGKKIPFAENDAPVAINETHLIGRHNQSNVAGAWTVVRELGVASDVAIAAIKEFRGLPHRLQPLGTHHGVEWIDDAISTTPDSTIAALNALGDRVATIILGGQDRGVDFTQLGKCLAESNVRTVILFPGSGPRIREAIERAGADVTFFDASSMKEAVAIARREIRNQESGIRNPICLLSTASPSYGMFKNFEEKGDAFARAIHASKG